MMNKYAKIQLYGPDPLRLYDGKLSEINNDVSLPLELD